MLPLIGTGISLAGNLFKTGLGLAQMIKGMGMKPIRPVYNIPEEVNQSLALNQANLNARSAGAARAEANISRNQSNALANIRQGANSGSQLLSSAALAQANSNNAYNQLAAQEAEDYQRRLANLNNSQTQMAAYRDKAFQLNEYEPYQDAAATKSALTQGGLTNTYNGLMDGGKLIGDFGLAQQYGYMPQFPQEQLQQNGIGYFRNRFMPGGFQGGLMGFNR